MGITAAGMFFLGWLAGYSVWRRSQARDAAGNPTTAGNLEAALKAGATVGAALFALGTFVVAGIAFAEQRHTTQDDVRGTPNASAPISCEEISRPGR